MTERIQQKSKSLPVQQNQRQRTDCCCSVIMCIFFIVMFLLASILWNQNKIVNIASHLTHQQQKQCSQQQHDYIYFQHLWNFHVNISHYQLLQSAECVKVCPNQSKNNQNFNNHSQKSQQFETNQQVVQQHNQNGFCFMYGEGSNLNLWKHKIYQLIDKNQGPIQTLIYVLIITLGWGLIKITLTQLFPRHAPLSSYLLSILLLLAFAGLILATNNIVKFLSKWSLYIGIGLIVFAIILTVMLCFYSSQLKFQGYMLQYAATYFNYHPITFISIPIFFIFNLALLILILWQFLSFSSQLTSNFYILDNITLSEILYFLNFVEYLWAFQFLKDSFTFCVSGNVTDWYWTKNVSFFQSYKRLLSKNCGSVALGSFLNGFFSIPTLIVQLLVCHPGTCCSSMGNVCYNFFSFLPGFFQTVRTDAYSYMNVTGDSFCQSAAQCSYLCGQSNLFVGYHSAIKHYRFSAHIGSVCFIFAWAFWIMTLRAQHSDWLLHVIVLVIFIYNMVTWFVCIHSDAAQALQTCYLMEFEMQKDYKYMQHLLPSIRKILQPIQNRVQGDGNC